MEPLKGTHGTSHSRATLIEREGFKEGTDAGRRGTGVYLWGYIDPTLEQYAEALAIGWWRFAQSERRYARDADKSCSVIYVGLSVSEADFDFEGQVLREHFIKFANEVYKRIRKGKSYNCGVGQVYDLFLKQIEDRTKKRFGVVHVRVSPPPKDYYESALPLDLTGHPSCYVVRNLSLIDNIRVKSHEHA